MILLFDNAGLKSGERLYVADEQVDEKGWHYSTFTKFMDNARRFQSEAEADEYNKRMVEHGNFAQPFQKQPIKI